jgi:hypothetical protein
MLSYVPIFVSLIGLVGATWTYAYQRQADRRNSLIELRRLAYRDFIMSIADISSYGGPVETLSYQKKLAELYLLGSDNVIRAVSEFTRLFKGTHIDPNLRLAKFAEMVVVMRQDGYESTDLSVLELSELAPFQF